MKINSLLLATGLFAIAALFAYCTKEQQTPTTSNSDLKPEVVERGVCNVSIFAKGGTITVCGTQANAVVCSPAGPSLPVALTGSDVIPTGATSNYTVVSPTWVSLTNNSGGPTLTVDTYVTSGGITKKYTVPTNGTAKLIRIDNNCIPL